MEPYHSDVEANGLGLVMWPLVVTAGVLFAAEALRAPRPSHFAALLVVPPAVPLAARRRAAPHRRRGHHHRGGGHDATQARRPRCSLHARVAHRTPAPCTMRRETSSNASSNRQPKRGGGECESTL